MREAMSSSEEKTLNRSIRVYRQLLRVYPRSFLNEFGDSLVQIFGDLARRALHSGGVPRLAVLWMRMLPDLGASAARQHLGGTAWLVPAGLKWRWIVACCLGFGIGGFFGHQLGRGMEVPAYYMVRSLIQALVLGTLQSGFALKRPLRDVMRWVLATATGMFILAMPFRILMGGLHLARLSLANEAIISLAAAAGVGILQCAVLPKAAHRGRLWIPAHFIGYVVAQMSLVAPVFAFGITLLTRLSAIDVSGMELWIGCVFGCVTCLPIESIVGGKPKTIEGAIES
jgi:hypothetical protein